MDQSWVKGFPGAITVCDRQGTIVMMNDAAILAYGNSGGDSLIGTNLLDCHPEPARSALVRQFETQRSNVYTIEKGATRKLIFQSPWTTETGEFGGLVEMSLEIPSDLPHYVR